MKKVYHFIVIVTIFVMAGSMTVTGQNLLTNPGFEDWTTNGAPGPPENWGLSSGSMTGSQEASTIHGGTYSVNLTWTTTSTIWMEQTAIPANPGDNYEFSFWVFDNDPGGRARVTVRWYDATSTFISGFYGDYSTDSPNWQLMTTGPQLAPTGTAYIHCEVRLYDVSAGWTGTATVYVDDAVLENTSAAPPAIVDAYATGLNSVDVFYSKPLTSVDPGDYYLTGTTYTTFSTATIDGSDASIVHLSGSNPAMAGDLTLDDVNDDNYGTSYTFYAGIMPISFTNTTNPGGVMNTTNKATFQGIISANDGFNNVWIADGSGARNGVMIYDFSFDGAVAVGDEVIMTAVYSPYQNLSELASPTLLSTLSTGNSPYGPDLIPGSDLDETIAADTDPAESWEGQLVTIENFNVESYDATNYEYRCSWSDGSTTYFFHIGDNVVYQLGGLTINVGVTYDAVTGIVDYLSTTGHYRINPRSQDDFIGGEPPTQLTIASVNGGLDPYANNFFDVVVQALDQFGNPAVVESDVNFTLVSNVGTSGVDFTAGSATTGTISTGFSEVTVSGVAMEPAGTGVILTVNDDASLLTSGTSDPFDVIEFVPAELIITEVMQNPAAVGDNDGEYFEVFNTSGTEINMNGYVIKDLGTDSFTVLLDVLIPANGFAVFGPNADNLTNGDFTVDYEYTGMFLSNSDDEIVIYQPDGVTEVTRIEWDGGPVWPDPNGAAMVFTGTTSQETNNGLNWAEATLREPSYVGATGDFGSPGTNGSDQNLVGGLSIDLTVFLEGPYLGGDLMSTSLNSNGYIPLSQPYGPALPYYDLASAGDIVWYYTGSESVASIPAGVVDWVYVQLRDADAPANATSATIIGEQAAFLLEDGAVVALDGSSMITFNATVSQNLYAVVFHRNHLGVMSANALTESGGVYSYDFSSGETQVYGGANGHKQLEPGVWGMISADGNGNGLIQNTDETAVWKTDLGNSGYMGGDFEMTGLTQNTDETNFWKPNLGGGGQTPAKANLGYECQVPK